MKYQNISGKESADKRTIRAATESMTVVSNGKGRFDVYSGEKGRYEVNLVFGTCDCPAAMYQEGDCKHVRRVEMETDLREIPDLGSRRLDVEIMTGADDETEQVAIADGGQLLEAPAEHADGCDNPECEGYDTDGRPLLSWECWEEWA